MLASRATLSLEGAAAVKVAVEEMEQTVAGAGYRLDGLIVQPMAPPGVELIVGVVNDHSFGPVLTCAAPGRDGSRADPRRLCADHSAYRSRRPRDDRLAEDIPATERIPRRGTLRRQRDRRCARARERDGRGPPRDRRARLQPAWWRRFSWTPISTPMRACAFITRSPRSWLTGSLPPAHTSGARSRSSPRHRRPAYGDDWMTP